jgi:hypothetical protein
LTLATLHALFVIQPIRFPKRSFVESVWQREQTLAEEIKKEPGGKQAKHKLGGTKRPGKCLSFLQPSSRQFSKALGADDAIIMLCNTFPAKEIPASRAPGNSFPQGMIETALISEIWHQTIRGGTFGSSTPGVVRLLVGESAPGSTAGDWRTPLEISSGVKAP